MRRGAQREDFEIRLEVLSQKEDLNFDEASIATHMTVKVVTNNGDIRAIFDGLLTRREMDGLSRFLLRLQIDGAPLVLAALPKIPIAEFSRTWTAPDIISRCSWGTRFLPISGTNSPKPMIRSTTASSTGESDHDFCCRLMEEFGISYFFEQLDGRHTMILADAKSSFSSIVGSSSIPYIALGGDSQRKEEHLYHWIPTRKFRDWQVCGQRLRLRKAERRCWRLSATQEPAIGQGSLENYDYPGRYTETDQGNQLQQNPPGSGTGRRQTDRDCR